MKKNKNLDRLINNFKDEIECMNMIRSFNNKYGFKETKEIGLNNKKTKLTYNQRKIDDACLTINIDNLNKKEIENLKIILDSLVKESQKEQKLSPLINDEFLKLIIGEQ